MNTLIILALLTIIAGIVIRLMDEAPLLDIALIIAGSVSLFFGLYIIDNPTAKDVYQGKTTLEITYKDGVPIDTVVVFKNKEK